MIERPLDDSALMRRIQTQDQSALPLLYQHYGRAIYSLAYHILGNTVQAEEVMQDVMIKVWSGGSQWDSEKGTLKNWLLGITHFTAIDRLRKERRQPALHPNSIDDLAEGRSRAMPTHSDATWQDELALRSLIDQLPSDQASLVNLAFFGGLSHSEIADTTRIPLGTVKTRLRTGLQRLRTLWMETIQQALL